jgi:hypothetical protein
MEPDDDQGAFALKWSRTFPDANDFTARDPARPTAFARVYLQPSHPDPAQRWFWTVSGTHHLGLGNEATVRAAARKAEEVYLAWRDKQ